MSKTPWLNAREFLFMLRPIDPNQRTCTMPSGVKGTGPYSRAAMELRRQRRRESVRQRELDIQERITNETNSGLQVVTEHAEQIGQPRNAMLTVETVQRHTTALHITNGHTVGQVIDSYIGSLHAASVIVRHVSLAIPEPEQ